jgi:hypothetical protein
VAVSIRARHVVREILRRLRECRVGLYGPHALFAAKFIRRFDDESFRAAEVRALGERRGRARKDRDKNEAMETS